MLMILLAILGGVLTTLSMIVSSTLGKKIGLIQSTIIHYIGGLIGGVFILIGMGSTSAPSILDMSKMPLYIFFGGIMLLMPFLASIPAAPLQVEEIRTLFAEQRIFKSSVAQYAKGKLIAAFLSGAIVAGGAFAAQAVLWNIIAKPCDVNIYDYLVIDFADSCIYNSWQYVLCGLPIYIWMTLMIAFSGGIWAIVGVTTAVYVRDKLMVLVIPSCIYYLWMSGLPHAVFGRTFPFPASLYNDSLTWALAGKAFLVYAVLAGVSVFLYIRKLREIACNG